MILKKDEFDIPKKFSKLWFESLSLYLKLSHR